jgi:hypothetical protein
MINTVYFADLELPLDCVTPAILRVAITSYKKLSATFNQQYVPRVRSRPISSCHGDARF